MWYNFFIILTLPKPLNKHKMMKKYFVLSDHWWGRISPSMDPRWYLAMLPFDKTNFYSKLHIGHTAKRWHSQKITLFLKTFWLKCQKREVRHHHPIALACSLHPDHSPVNAHEEIGSSLLYYITPPSWPLSCPLWPSNFYNCLLYLHN